jgi:hypothetical protein
MGRAMVEAVTKVLLDWQSGAFLHVMGFGQQLHLHVGRGTLLASELLAGERGPCTEGSLCVCGGKGHPKMGKCWIDHLYRMGVDACPTGRVAADQWHCAAPLHLDAASRAVCSGLMHVMVNNTRSMLPAFKLCSHFVWVLEKQGCVRSALGRRRHFTFLSPGLARLRGADPGTVTAAQVLKVAAPAGSGSGSGTSGALAADAESLRQAANFPIQARHATLQDGGLARGQCTWGFCVPQAHAFTMSSRTLRP